ncbi:hypothetical protein HPP92_018054 [Vanilla planifolia]|uniref:SHSP domain-containing protein n=1 Tax=Vanilla planifolia TaxID=51239 RepID=A0A835Q937_VANPL|nr:hypothetical protein HPP92_018054 [Vanilla planifolia]
MDKVSVLRRELAKYDGSSERCRFCLCGVFNMRVHPTPAKKLKRLPHIFSKVLELPYGSDADVYVEEDHSEFRFFVTTDGVGRRVRVDAVVIHPGVMKVVVSEDGGGVGGEGDYDLDRWRFRLPPSSRPALATAEYVRGELMVMVPKGNEPEDYGEAFEEGDGDFPGTALGQLVVVQ